MASINEITQAGYYQGNAGLGTADNMVLKFDLQPLQRLSDYTFMRNQDLYRNKYAEWKDNAAKVADALSIDWSNIRPEYAKDIHKKEEELKNFLRENPGAAVQSGTDAFIKFHQMKNDLSNLTKAGAARSVEYAAMAKDIAAKAPNGEIYKAWMEDLDKRTQGRDIYTPINPFEQYLTKAIDWTGQEATLANETIGPNYIRSDKYTGVDYSRIGAQAAQMPMNFDARQVGTGPLKQLQDMAGAYNELFANGIYKQPGYVEKDKDGNFIRFTSKAKNDPTYGPLVNLVQNYNDGAMDYNRANPGMDVELINPAADLDDRDIYKLLIASTIERKVSKEFKRHGAADERAENAANRRTQKDIAGMHYGPKSNQTGQPISLHNELAITVDNVIRNKGAQAMLQPDGTNAYYVPFDQLDEGVKERMKAAVKGSLYNPMSGMPLKDVFVKVYNGQMSLATKDPSGSFKDGGTLSQTSLDNLDLNANRMTTTDAKMMGQQGSGQSPVTTTSRQDF